MGRLGLRARTQVYHWGKNGANHAPFSANLCQCTCGCQHEKRRPSPVIVGLGAFFCSYSSTIGVCKNMLVRMITRTEMCDPSV